MRWISAFIPVPCLILFITLAPVQGAIAAAPATPATQPAHFVAPIPHRAGHFRIRFQDVIDGQRVQIMTVISVSQKMAAAKEKVPMVVFLCGVGERGQNGDGVFLNGPSGEMERNPVLKSDLPVVALSPQCPEDRRWDDPIMVKAVIDCIEVAKRNPWIDPNQIYITGLSMGGKGTWLVAEAAPQLFAAIAPLSAIAVEPQHAAQVLKGVPTWIIVGSEDENDFRHGSEQMADAMKKAGGDVLLSEMPGVGHNTWTKTYSRMEFYQWLTFAQRGQPPKPGRPTPAELNTAINRPPNDFQQRLDREFHQFAQYWSLISCGNFKEPGLKGIVNGRKNVFVTYPLTSEIPCTMQTTWTIPSGRTAKLSLIVGNHPDGEWKLLVRANGQEALSKIINKESTKDGWLETSIDLTPYAGHDVRLEVQNAAGSNWDNCVAYWAKVAVEFK